MTDFSLTHSPAKDGLLLALRAKRTQLLHLLEKLSARDLDTEIVRIELSENRANIRARLASMKEELEILQNEVATIQGGFDGTDDVPLPWGGGGGGRQDRFLRP